MYNNHCYKLNSNVNSFVHKLNNKDVVYQDQDMYKNMETKLSTKFYFRNFENEADKIFIDNLDDIVPHVKSNSERKNINFITNTDMKDILFQMIDKSIYLMQNSKRGFSVDCVSNSNLTILMSNLFYAPYNKVIHLWLIMN